MLINHDSVLIPAAVPKQSEVPHLQDLSAHAEQMWFWLRFFTTQPALSQPFSENSSATKMTKTLEVNSEGLGETGEAETESSAGTRKETKGKGKGKDQKSEGSQKAFEAMFNAMAPIRGSTKNRKSGDDSSDDEKPKKKRRGQDNASATGSGGSQQARGVVK